MCDSNGIGSFIDQTIEKGKSDIKQELRNEDGYLICPVCGELREKEIDFGENLGGFKLVPISCRCEKEQLRQEQEQIKKRERFLQRQKIFGGRWNRQMGYTFEADDRMNPALSDKLRKYCENFESSRKKGEGIMLYSRKNGGGKTFMACAVANELITRGYRVMISNIPDLRDEMIHSPNRKEYLQSLHRYDLIVLDDVGMECGSDLTREMEYRIIDNLTENRVSLMVTTNYTPKEMSESKDRNLKRIYDRILGCCALIAVEPPKDRSRRIDRCEELTRALREEEDEA